MYKTVKKTKAIRICMEYLALHTGAPRVHWEDNTTCISVVESKRVNPRVKHIGITVYLYKKIDNVIFVPKYEKSNVMPQDMCTKTCSCPIISRSTKWTTGFRFYPTSDTEHNQILRLHEFYVN